MAGLPKKELKSLVEKYNPRKAAWRQNALKTIVERGTIRDVETFLEGLTGASGGKLSPGSNIMKFLLVWAANVGKLNTVKFLVENQGADVNCRVLMNRRRYRSPMQAAAGGGHNKCLKFLMEKGADVNASLPLLSALRSDQWQCLRLLVKYGADVNPTGIQTHTPLKIAVRYGRTRDVQLLLEAGADINVVGWKGCTALTTAIQNGQSNLVKLLVEQGADVNPKESRSENPLLEAVRFKDSDVVKYLIEKGADVNSTDRNEAAPLLLAMQLNKWQCVKLLVEAGADVNIADTDNKSVLIIAVQRGQTECLKLFLDAGADVNTTTYRFGSTALCEAVTQESLAHAKLLLRAGADVTFPVRSWEQYHCKGIEMAQLLFAAGKEYVLYKSPTFLGVQFYPPDWEDLDLKNQCRKVIRKHLLTLDPKSNLFAQVTQLQMTHDKPGLPEHMVSYLLFGQDHEIHSQESSDSSSAESDSDSSESD